MGLLGAAHGAVTGVAADQWLEYFNCEALPENVLAVEGRKWANGRRGPLRASGNVISNGSKIAVADGQCMLVVEQGRILDVCAEPGEYTLDIGSEPSIFGGQTFKDGAEAALKNTWERFKFGGHPGKDMRVFYFNTKELIGNKYGTPNAVPFRVVDERIGLDVDIAIRFFGQYSFRIVDPILFYTHVTGNFANAYLRDQLAGQLKAEVLAALQPAIAKISAMGIRYSALPHHATEMADALNEALSPKWRGLRGIEIVSFSIASVNASPEDEQLIKELQRTAVLRDPTMAAATLVGAQANALQAAAANEAGAIGGFVGLGMAQGSVGGVNAQNLFELGKAQKDAVPPSSPPAAELPGSLQWACACGNANASKFCSECGLPKPEAAAQIRCDKCSWTPPAATATPPKFCPECGDPIDDNDVV